MTSLALVSHPDAPRGIDWRSKDSPGSDPPRVGVSVVVPMFNEEACAAQLASSLQTLEAAYAEELELEFLLVDDGSEDATVASLQKLIGDSANYRIVKHNANRGIAAAIQTGLREARYEIVASIDSDGSYDPIEIGPMVAMLSPEVDLVTASPYHPDGGVQNVPHWRLRISRLASVLYGLVVRQRLCCYTSCFRVYRREAALSAEPRNRGFVGVAELLWRMDRNGSRIAEYPTVLRGRVAGHSKMRVVRASFGHMKLIALAGADRTVRRLGRREIRKK